MTQAPTKRLLIVDPDARVRALLSAFFTKNGFSARAMEVLDDPAAASVRCPQVILWASCEDLAVFEQVSHDCPGASIVYTNSETTTSAAEELASILSQDREIPLEHFTNTRALFGAVTDAGVQLETWYEGMKNELQQVFPLEYDVLYGATADMPTRTELEAWLSELLATESV